MQSQHAQVSSLPPSNKLFRLSYCTKAETRAKQVNERGGGGGGGRKRLPGGFAGKRFLFAPPPPPTSSFFYLTPTFAQ